MEGKYDIAMVFDYGKERIQATERGGRVLVFRAIADGKRASAAGAKVTLVIKDPEGRETVHRYNDGQAVE